ncbi:MAG: dUTP diphosphatase [Alphaproteobacteria bacterium]|nr:dUTP diphosphatase [Alphaproteobacteria bacterium]
MQLFVKYLENYAKNWPRLSFAKQYDSGLDLRAAISKPFILKAGTRTVIPNGVQVEMKADTTNFEIQIRPRSGLAVKKGIIVVNTPGTVDWGYRGELMTILLNTGDEDFEINPGDRIAQAVICPIVRPQIVEADDLSETERGNTGFGSSGI